MIRLLTSWPAMLVETDERVMIASDFHIGIEYELAKMGISIPYQTERLLRELLSIVEENRPDRLVLLGDIKHGVPITSFQERQEIPKFFTALKEAVAQIDVIPGNHDGDIGQLLPQGVNLHSSRGFMLGDKFRIAAIHGHAWPYPKLMSANLIVMGHNHPTVLLKTPLGIRISQRAWVKGRCSGTAIARTYLKKVGIDPGENPRADFERHFRARIRSPLMVIIPTFNDLLGGLPINVEPPKSLLGPLMRSGAIDIDRLEVYLLDGTFLGKVKFLRTLA